ncbi:hypothetical protein [Streptomyces sp. RPT161]|uniref:hypothetical protein n=1 Tax=Streptomyces sp. RPT161 TaxID=3015993 RepID=UPI0022B88C68|nr:hypothetical protein [Streptomyces sp. RPT161]
MVPNITSTNHVLRGDTEGPSRRVHEPRLADDELVGGDLIGTVVREMRSDVRLYNGTCHTEAVGLRPLVELGELAQLAGRVATDSGAEPLSGAGEAIRSARRNRVPTGRDRLP